MLVATAVVVADKPDNPGKPPKDPPPPPPEGTVYFQTYNDGNLEMWTMKADGSEKTQLGIYPGIDGEDEDFGAISRLKHGDHYWFIRFCTVGGNYPDGPLVRELFAVRDDGAVEVQLTDDPTLATNSVGGRAWVWGINDESIEWSAKRWVDGVLDMDSFGIYSAGIDFDANGDVIGLSEEPTMIWNTGTHSSGPKYHPNVKRFDWSPDGSQMVLVKIYHNDILYEIFIVDIVAQTETDLGTTGYRVRWSPDGNKIAFIQNQNLGTINPDGTDEEIIVPSEVKGKTEKTVADKIDWSPDSSHLVYTWRVIRYGNDGPSGHYEVRRVEANGDNPTSMTNDLDVYAGSQAWR
jgi:hypothetical protein